MHHDSDGFRRPKWVDTHFCSRLALTWTSLGGLNELTHVESCFFSRLTLTRMESDRFAGLSRVHECIENFEKKTQNTFSLTVFSLFCGGGTSYAVSHSHVSQRRIHMFTPLVCVLFRALFWLIMFCLLLVTLMCFSLSVLVLLGSVLEVLWCLCSLLICTSFHVLLFIILWSVFGKCFILAVYLLLSWFFYALFLENVSFLCYLVSLFTNVFCCSIFWRIVYLFYSLCFVMAMCTYFILLGVLLCIWYIYRFF